MNFAEILSILVYGLSSAMGEYMRRKREDRKLEEWAARITKKVEKDQKKKEQEEE